MDPFFIALVATVVPIVGFTIAYAREESGSMSLAKRKAKLETELGLTGQDDSFAGEHRGSRVSLSYHRRELSKWTRFHVALVPLRIGLQIRTEERPIGGEGSGVGGAIVQLGYEHRGLRMRTIDAGDGDALLTLAVRAALRELPTKHHSLQATDLFVEYWIRRHIEQPAEVSLHLSSLVDLANALIAARAAMPEAPYEKRVRASWSKMAERTGLVFDLETLALSGALEQQDVQVTVAYGARGRDNAEGVFQTEFVIESRPLVRRFALHERVWGSNAMDTTELSLIESGHRAFDARFRLHADSPGLAQKVWTPERAGLIHRMTARGLYMEIGEGKLRAVMSGVLEDGQAVERSLLTLIELVDAIAKVGGGAETSSPGGYR